MSDNVVVFDGTDDYIQTGSFTLGAMQSWSLWFNISGCAAEAALAGKNYSGTNPGIGILMNSGGAIKALLSPTQSPGSLFTVTASGRWDDGIWHHIGVSFEPGSQLSTYTDGAFNTGSSPPYRNISDGGVLVMGAYPSLAKYYPGKLEDLRVYNRVLAADDFKMLYAQGASSTNDLQGRVIFTGLLEDINFNSVSQSSDAQLAGRDYGAALQDITIPPEVYTNKEVSWIIIDFMQKYVTGITYNNVNYTGVIVPRMTFNHTSVFMALKQFSDLTGYAAWVDKNKDLHFEQPVSTNSGLVLGHNNSTTIRTVWKSTRKEIANAVYVYGDMQLTGVTGDTTTTGAVTANGGSVYTLSYKPHNTNIQVSGIQQQGGVYQMTTLATSGINYLVNYEDKQIIFTSGTTIGDSIPSSGTLMNIAYQRDRPIIKFGIDRASVDIYKQKNKIIMDSSIKDPEQAADVMLTTLENEANPKTMGDILLQGYHSIENNTYCLCNYPLEGIGSRTYDIIGISYDLASKNLFADQFLTIKVNQKIKDVTDELVSMKENILQLQAANVTSTDGLTRYETATGDIIIPAYWYVSSRTIGSSFVLGHPFNGTLGSVNHNILGSSTAGAYSIIKSGGDF